MAKGKDGFSSFEDPNSGQGAGEGEAAELETEEGEGYIDLAGTSEDVDFPLIPRGIFDAELVEMEFGHSQKSGSPMWTTIWELLDDKLENNGKRPRQWVHLTFNEGGLPRVKRALARMQVDGDYNKELLNGKFSPERVADEGKLIGAMARLRIDIRRYEGKPRNNVKEILPPNAKAGGGFGSL